MRKKSRGMNDVVQTSWGVPSIRQAVEFLGGECKNALLHTMICFRGITYYYDSVKHVEFADFFIKQETQLQTRGHLY
jgi:hypothetical protein